jgi:hypothetical protein
MSDPTPEAVPAPRPDPDGDRSEPVVTLTLWGVPGRQVPAAVLRMAADRRPLRTAPGLRFAKLLGTGDGRTFTPRDADPRHWGLLAVWDAGSDAAAFTTSRTWQAWDRLAHERLTVTMTPLTSRGRWSGREPFGAPVPRRVTGPVAAITRARLRLRTTPGFWRAVPPVSADLRTVPGLRLAVGIGEAPIGLQGTFSLWDRDAALIEFAYRRSAHREVIARTAAEGWFIEELFARFEVLSVDGTFAGRQP